MWADLTRERWEQASAAEQEAVARKLARDLPEGFVFDAVRNYSMGDQTRSVAEFSLGDAAFILIPGGPVTIGYDAERKWKPNRDERRSWKGTAEEYNITVGLPEFLAKVTLPRRNIEIGSFLIEKTAAEIGWSPCSPEDPAIRPVIQDCLDRCESVFRIETHQKGIALRVQRDHEGVVHVQLSKSETPARINARLAAEGFRFPTCDEWEYCCGAGSETLFRWGDHAPCDRYPEASKTVRNWKGEELPPWAEHLKPNAFGLYMASNPYHYELTADPAVTRGGDGGGNICGGVGFFLGWLTLATAYFEDHACRQNPEKVIALGYTVGRRVLPLA